MILLALLSLLSLVAATSVATRFDYRLRAEKALAVFVFWNLFILVPVYALGLTRALDRPRLALASAVTFALATVLSTPRRGAQEHLRNLIRTWRDFARVVPDAFKRAWEAKSGIVLCLAFGLGLLLWALLLTYLFPSDSWDGIQYHEPMVGFSIQTHSILPMHVPTRAGEAIDGYPRNSEMTSLWFTLLHDRRWIELPSVIAAVPYTFAAYAIVRRYAPDRVTPMGFACAALTIPAAALLLRTTYIDLHAAAAFLCVIYFATRVDFRLADAWMSACAIALAVGTKYTLLPWAGVFAVMAGARVLVLHVRRRPLPSVAALVGGGAIILLGTVKYIQNWILLGSPLYPRQLDLFKKTAGGAVEMDDRIRALNKPFFTFLGQAMSVFTPGHDFADTQIFGYGSAVPWIVFPMAAVATVVLARRLVVGVLPGFAENGSRRLDRNLLLVLVGIAPAVYVTPALDQARYNLHVPVVLFALVAWFSRVIASVRLADAVACIVVANHAMMMAWATPGFNIGPDQLTKALTVPATARAGLFAMPWVADADMIAARERELGENDVVLVTTEALFLTPFWNEHFSNRLEVTAATDAPSILRRADEVGAEWVAVGVSSPAKGALDAQPGKWQQAGVFFPGQTEAVYRRVSK